MTTRQLNRLFHQTAEAAGIKRCLIEHVKYTGAPMHRGRNDLSEIAQARPCKQLPISASSGLRDRSYHRL